MRFLVFAGIGDSLWGCTKAKSISDKLGDGRVSLKIAIWNMNVVETRSVKFLERFSFVDGVEPYMMPNRNGAKGPALLPGPEADKNGYYRYIPDGKSDLPGIDYVLAPNYTLERGIRLEDWLPEFKIDWNVMDKFQWNESEIDYADKFKEFMGNYVVFFMASQDGNTFAGHNRLGIWKPDDWINLGDALHQRYGVNIVVVGTSWDESYYDINIRHRVRNKNYWHNYIDQWEIGTTLRVIKNCQYMVSYQSGLADVCSFLGLPTVQFWRAKGDSICEGVYVSFEENMSTACISPDILSSKKYMGAIYGRHGVNDILKCIEDNKW